MSLRCVPAPPRRAGSAPSVLSAVRYRPRRPLPGRIGLFESAGVSFQDSFAPAFRVAFALHAAAGEWWLRRTPALTA